MKNTVTAGLLMALAALLVINCAGTPQFSAVKDKDWILAEIQKSAETVKFDRSELKDEGFGDYFSLRFDNERVSGVGAPNRYFMPYTLGEKNAIAIQMGASTMMAPLREPEKLKEFDYLACLHNTSKWRLSGNNLELVTRDVNGADIIMVFTPAGK